MLADVEGADSFSDTAQGRDHLLAMLAAFSVIVGKHHDIRAAEMLGVFVAPLLNAAGIGRRRETDGTEVIDILLALGDVDRLPGGHSLHEFGQQVRDAAGIPQLPNPATVAIRSTLAEILRLEAHNLEQKLTGLVAVVIGLDDLGIGMADDLRGPEQAFALQPYGRRLVSPTADQVEYPTAFVGLVVEPSALLDVDHQ